MRFLGLMVLLLAIVLGVGLYLGWFHVGWSHTGNTSTITATVDKETIHKDESSARDEAQHVGQEVKDAGATTAPK